MMVGNWAVPKGRPRVARKAVQMAEKLVELSELSPVERTVVLKAVMMVDEKVVWMVERTAA